MQPEINYSAPEWSKVPEGGYTMEVIKGGVLLDLFKLEGKPFFIAGRIPTCDIPMEHESVSRLHAVLQFGSHGLFIYDLGSTHGTFVNKKKVPARNFVLVPSGSFIKFGESTRHYVVKYPEVSNVEIAESITTEEPTAWYVGHAKKYLKKYMERTNQTIKFDISEDTSQFTAKLRITVPIDKQDRDLANDDFNDPLIANGKNKKKSQHVIETMGTGKSKKIAEDQAIMKACAQLDEIGVLKPEKGADDMDQDDMTSDMEEEEILQMRAEKNRLVNLIKARDEEWDDTSFYDRTTDAKRNNAAKPKAETYETLCNRYQAILEDINDVSSQLAGKVHASTDTKAIGDDLDSYMLSINSVLQGNRYSDLQRKLDSLTKEKDTLVELIEFTKPVLDLKAVEPVRSHVKTTVEKMPKSKGDSGTLKLSSDILPTAIQDSIDAYHVKTSSTPKQPPQKAMSATALRAKEQLALLQREAEMEMHGGLNLVAKKAKIDADADSRVDEEVIKETFTDNTTKTEWHPPKGQAGDGRTSLNEKLGY